MQGAGKDIPDSFSDKSFSESPAPLMPFPSVRFVLVILTSPKLPDARAFRFHIFQKICIIWRLRSPAAERTLRIGAGFIQPLVAGRTAPCVVLFYMVNRFLSAFLTHGFRMPAKHLPFPLIPAEPQIILSAFHPYDTRYMHPAHMHIIKSELPQIRKPIPDSWEFYIPGLYAAPSAISSCSPALREAFRSGQVQSCSDRLPGHSQLRQR